jgi:hypothetical protein
VELSRSEKLFLVQRYLDLCKLELFEPGPLTKRNNQVEMTFFSVLYFFFGSDISLAT